MRSLNAKARIGIRGNLESDWATVLIARMLVLDFIMGIGLIVLTLLDASVLEALAILGKADAYPENNFALRTNMLPRETPDVVFIDYKGSHQLPNSTNELGQIVVVNTGGTKISNFGTNQHLSVLVNNTKEGRVTYKMSPKVSNRTIFKFIDNGGNMEEAFD